MANGWDYGARLDRIKGQGVGRVRLGMATLMQIPPGAALEVR